MPTPQPSHLRLPERPSLDQLRKQARELQQHLRSGDPSALSLVAELYPGTADEAFPLHIAQLVVARRYGLRSWPALVAHVEVIGEYFRSPDLDPDGDDPVEMFLTHAVLRYGDDDGPARWQSARTLLAESPWIAGHDIYTASTTANPAAVQQFLASDAGTAGRAGGPLRWEPLLYLTYARYNPEVPAADVLATARLLLSAGADPDAGYLWHGLTSPFTALTGAFGSGEMGLDNQPRHPHAQALARLLLEAGADPNDSQGLYNRMFTRDDSHLVLLFEFGLGSGDGGPWRRRLPELTQSPAQLVRGQLSWAVSHGMSDRIRLLASHGVDLESPFEGGIAGSVTPLELAFVSGRPETAALLEDLGARAADLAAATRLIGALLAGDANLVATLTDADPELLATVRRAHPSLVLRATVAGSVAGIDLLLTNGFDVNALGRQDLPVEQEWESALHHAAGEGNRDLAGRLLAAGADPNILDRRFHSTPLGWAEHLGHPEMVELLRPLTSG